MGAHFFKYKISLVSAFPKSRKFGFLALKERQHTRATPWVDDSLGFSPERALPTYANNKRKECNALSGLHR